MTATSARDVCIAGWGLAGPVAVDPRSIPEMVLEAVQAALANAAMSYDDIDAVVTASVDVFDGLTASNIAVTEVVGAVMKPETRIAADGLCAAIHAACQIRAGAYDTVLVVAHAKPSMSDYHALTEWALDPIFLQPLGIDFLGCAGLQASTIASRDKGALERWAKIAARRLADAQGGGAQVPTETDVLDSDIVAAPLRDKMCAPLADGACACILRRVNGDGVLAASGEETRLTGLGHDLAASFIGDRDLAESSGLARAARRAYADAGISSPAEEIDIAEPSVAFAHEEDLFVQATGIDGNTTISPDGGLFAGYVPIVAGLSRLAAAADFLRKHDELRALAHGSWGPAGQGQAVVVLENTA